jgi:hypothetical protein
MLVEGLVLIDGGGMLLLLSKGSILTDGKLLIEGLELTDGFIVLTDGTPLNEERLLIDRTE